MNTNLFSIVLLAAALPAAAQRGMEMPESSLVRAVRTGEPAEVADMLRSHSISPFDRCHAGKSLASYAAERGSVEILKLLEKAGVSLTGKDCDRDSPLYEAAEQGHAEAVRFLLAKKAGASFRVGNGSTPLLAALRGPLFETGPAGDVHETVRLLLAAGSDPDAQDEFGHTPLIVATRRADAKLIRLLLDRKADPRKKDTDGVSALDIARKEGLDFIAAMLEGREKKATHDGLKLISAIKAGDRAAASKFISRGVDPNSVDEKGTPALTHAAYAGLSDVGESLVRRGAAVNARNAVNDTALVYAAAKGLPALVKLLLERGADPKIRDYYGNSPLAYALQEGKLEAARLLLAGGADPDETDKEAATLLMTAAKKGDEAAVRVLLQGGAKADAADKEGRTALMLAAGEGKREAVLALLAGGADAGRKDNDGATALQHALNGRHAEVVDVLMGKAKPGQGELVAAIRNWNVEAARRVLRAGASPNPASPGDPVPLVEAANAYENRLALTRLLVEAGAKVNAADAEKNTPLMKAADWSGEDSQKTLEYLLAAGADPKPRDDKGLTAWTRAMLHGNNAAAAALRKAGAKPEYDALHWENSFLKDGARAAAVVTDPESWETLWKRLGTGLPVPAIDFKTHVAAYVILGELRGPDSAVVRFGEPAAGKDGLKVNYTVGPSIIYDADSSSPYAVKVFARGKAERFLIDLPPDIKGRGRRPDWME